MSQYAYILVCYQSSFSLLVNNKYEKEKLQRLLQNQLLKDRSNYRRENLLRHNHFISLFRDSYFKRNR